MLGWNCSRALWLNHGWGVISWHCLGSLERASTSFNAIRYVELLGNLHQSVYVVLLSARSPDLNPIKYLWDVLEQDVKGHPTAPTNLPELCTALANFWQVIPVGRLQKRVESMPCQVATITKARGGPTRS
ncbi:transposable element Tcb2 transposase [Trichonephila clavipes]|nr:transposable element Tcb2 transposase [Trichonephila clavipes]